MNLNIQGRIQEKTLGWGNWSLLHPRFFSNVAPRLSIIPAADHQQAHNGLALPYTIYRTALGGFKLQQNGSAAEPFCGRTILRQNHSVAEPFCGRAILQQNHSAAEPFCQSLNPPSAVLYIVYNTLVLLSTILRTALGAALYIYIYIYINGVLAVSFSEGRKQYHLPYLLKQ